MALTSMTPLSIRRGALLTIEVTNIENTNYTMQRADQGMENISSIT